MTGSEPVCSIPWRAERAGDGIRKRDGYTVHRDAVFTLDGRSNYDYLNRRVGIPLNSTVYYLSNILFFLSEKGILGYGKRNEE